MFKIDIEHNGTTYHVQTGIDNVVIGPILEDGINQLDTLTYSIAFDDDFRQFYEEKVTIVKVYNEDNILEYQGILEEIEDMGAIIEMRFYSELLYLSWIDFPPYSFQGDITVLIDDVLSYYNSHCSANRTIEKGIITVTDSNGYITRENQDDSTCYDVIFEKLVGMLGGYIRLRYVNNKRYLDYLIDFDSVAPQKIEYSVNLLDLVKSIDSRNIATVIVPRGFRDTETNQRLTIESVNNGLDYLESPLVSKYGIIRKVVVWDDVTLPENLKSKAQAYLVEMVKSNLSLSINAIDLGFMDEQVRRFRIGDTINVVSAPHNINIQIILTHRTRHLNDPSQDKLELGDTQKSFTQAFNNVESVSNQNDSKLGGNFLETIINDQTQSLLGGLGGYIKFKYVDNHPVALLAMDSESETTATNMIMLNSSGLGFSHNGGQSYDNAWTIEGMLNASFIRTGKIAGECFEFDLDTGRCVWGKRDENQQFIDNSTMTFDAQSLILNAKRGIIIDDGTTLFRSQLTENFMEFSYDNERLLRLDPNGLESKNIVVEKYITLKDTSRIERFEMNGNVYTGHFSLGGN